MSQIELFSIDNPCIGVCQSGKGGYCIGCLRTRDERQNWYQMSDVDRHHTIKLLARRRRKLNKLIADQHLKDRIIEEYTTPDLFGED